jgi:hypothetical protein
MKLSAIGHWVMRQLDQVPPDIFGGPGWAGVDLDNLGPQEAPEPVLTDHPHLPMDLQRDIAQYDQDVAQGVVTYNQRGESEHYPERCAYDQQTKAELEAMLPDWER